MRPSFLSISDVLTHIKSHIVNALESGPHCGSAVIGYGPRPISLYPALTPMGGERKEENQMANRKTVKKTWDVDACAYSSIETIADQENCTVTQIVNEALRYYADRHYLENNATMLSSDILEAMKSTVSLLERRLDNRSNQLLSSMAIQLFIINKVLADSLDLSGDALEQYRVQAVEFLKGNNRLLDLREVI